MAKKSPPSFQFYTGDWLSSERIAAMKPEQEGAYIRLLAYVWESEGCCISKEENSLRILSRLGKRWQKFRTEILKCFCPCPEHEDRLTNKKLWEVRQEHLSYLDRKRKAGSRGADQRWHKHGTPIGLPSTDDSTPIVLPMPNDSPPPPTPPPTPQEKKKTTNKARAREMPADFEPNETHRGIAEKLALNLADELAAFRHHAVMHGRTLIDWNAGFCGWLHNAPKYGGRNGYRPTGRASTATSQTGGAGHPATDLFAEDKRIRDQQRAERDAKLAAAAGS